MNRLSTEDRSKEELAALLDTQEITSDNIGDIRRSLFRADGKWNAMVRDETAARERGICPQCQASLIFPNPRTSDGQAYCEECGYPDENRPANPNCVRCGKGGTYCDGERWLCDECSIAVETKQQ